MGSIDLPITPLSLALASEASFVARAMDVDKNLGSVLEAAAMHKGAAFVEILQDCNIFNHKAFDYATNRDTKEENVIWLEHGKPLVYGKDRDKGIAMDKAGRPAIIKLGENGATEDDLLIHDESNESLAFFLSRLKHPEFPEPMGVFYRIEDDCYEELLQMQVDHAKEFKGEGTLEKLFNEGDTYTVDS